MNAFRHALESQDAATLRRLWAGHSPHLPQPATDGEALVMLHRARTEAASLPLAKRLYSHAWLKERGLPSGLPDDLRPPPQRGRGRIVAAVGVAVRPRSPDRADRAKAIEAAMSRVAGEALRAGVTDMREVSRAMWAERERVIRGE